MEASKLPNTEFKTVVLGVFKELRERIDELSGDLRISNEHKKDIETIKKKQSEIKNIEGINKKKVTDTDRSVVTTRGKGR